MKRFVLFLCGLLWPLIFCGCIDITASFEGLEPADHNKIPRYKIPIKFHLQRVYFAETELPLFMKYRNSAGIFGFLGLRYLLSPAENAWFYGNAAREFNVLSIQNHHRKDFARLIVAELCKIPAEEIEKLYLARKTREIQLME